MRFGQNTVVDQLSFTVQSGEIFGLVGPDGAGKSTTMRVLAGVLRPNSGRVTIAGCDVIGEPELAKQYISYMPQRFGLYEDLSVQENLDLYADLHGVDAATRHRSGEPIFETAAMASAALGQIAAAAHLVPTMGPNIMAMGLRMVTIGAHR